MLRKNWKKILIILFALIVLFFAWALWPERPSVAAFANLGEQYDVRILRDTWGVLHVYGKTDRDVAFGLAYAHAEDDFLTIQQTLAASLGMLARAYGQDSAPADYLAGLLRVNEIVEGGYDTLSPEARAVMEAYADGLNYYAYQHPDQALLPDLFPVTGKAIVAGSVYKEPLFFGIDSTIGKLYADARKYPVAVKGQPASSMRTEPLPFQGVFAGEYGLYGSNAFAVAPSRTPDGSTYLAVNSHQPWTGPVAWYEAHVHSEEGWEASGATFPGTPAIIHGHNRVLGWAFTVNHPDLTDVYVLEMNPENKNQYRFDGEWRDLETGKVTIWVKLFGRLRIPVQQEVLRSVYGPTVRRPHGVYALRYAGYGKVNTFEQLYRMNKAQDFEQWRQAMKEGGLPNFNVVYADNQGNIFYLYNAMLPMRSPDYDWSIYLPGNTSETLWTETISLEQMPQVFNPASGFIQNANSTPYQTTSGPGNPRQEDFPVTFGIESYMTNRALRLLELFNADTSITFDEFEAYKYDWSYSQESDVARMVKAITQAQLPADPAVQAGQQVLRQWDLQAGPESTGITVMVYWLEELYKVDAARSSRLVGAQLDVEVLESTFITALQTLQSHFGKVEVPWSEVNRIVRGNLDIGRAGGPDLLHASYGDFDEKGRIINDDGDGFIQLVHWLPDGTVSAFSVHQFGSATLDATSPHYNDQSPLYARRELKLAWFEEAEVLNNLEREYKP